MKEISKQLAHIVTASCGPMRKISAENWNRRSAPEKWSKKQILGHMIDSAANNHQRFVRAQYGDTTTISYDGNAWVKVQDYNSEDVSGLVELWINYNLHLARVISKIPADKYDVLFGADAKEPVTLEWIVKDYVQHLEHHLAQILG